MPGIPTNSPSLTAPLYGSPDLDGQLPISLNTDGQSQMLDDILCYERIAIHFQPILSIRRNVVLGLEALARGINADGSLIAPAELFGMAHQCGRTLELDQLCRRRAVAEFAAIKNAEPQLILFLNLHPQTTAREVHERDFEHGAATDAPRAAHLDPRKVALEVLELETEDTAALAEMVDTLKHNGFLMALDDVGQGHSNLDRIAAIKPDILKADRSLICDIDREYHKQEVLKSLVTLSEKIGGWLIAEGIETEEEALMALSLGADMMQGFYFARPAPMNAADFDDLHQAVAVLAEKFKNHTLDRVIKERSEQEKRLDLLNQMTRVLSQDAATGFQAILATFASQHQVLESCHVLNESGVQIGECVVNPQHDDQIQKTVIFAAPAPGSDHSLKEYFYLLKGDGMPFFTTQPYVPRPTGNLCVTISTAFSDAEDCNRILCVAFRLPPSESFA